MLFARVLGEIGGWFGSRGCLFLPQYLLRGNSVNYPPPPPPHVSISSVPPPIKAGLKLRAFSMKERGGGKCKKRIEKSPPPSLPWPPMHHSPFHCCELPLQAKLRTSFAPDTSRFTVLYVAENLNAKQIPHIFSFSQALVTVREADSEHHAKAVKKNRER